MAYRTERRERPHETYAPSYLDDFLVSIEPLQTSTKSTFADIKGLDDRVQTTVALADAAADDTILRANSSAAIASVRRQYQEFIVLQTNAQELADKKADLAAAALKGLDTVLAELDDKLHDFEAQLKREGRWPGATTLTQPTQPKAPTHSTQPPTASAAPTKAAEPPATRNAHKADRRPSQPPPSSKNPVSTAAEPVAAKPVVDATPAPQDVVMKDSAPDVIKKEAQPLSDVITDSAMDNTLYCICQQVSSGNMVACEDHNCPYEWFHFECVGLTEEPDGVWYCPECTEKRKKASRRKQ